MHCHRKPNRVTCACSAHTRRGFARLAFSENSLSLTARLKRHPFAVAAHFDRVVALSFAFPADVVRPVVPPTLALDLFDGVAFVTVAMVWTRALRPAVLPATLGADFFLAGYRVFTRFAEPSGRRLRGLRILRSDTDKARMVLLGNLMTGYRYRRVAVQVDESGVDLRVRTTCAGVTTLDVSLTLASGDVALPTGSPFRDWTEARRFAGPMPFTFSPEGDNRMVVVEGSRQHWEPRPVHVHSWQVAMFKESPFRNATPVLANAFVVDDVAYQWKRGRVVEAAGSSA
jgi:uncharacterized protein YqjF (DUF2071 family)